MAHCQPCLIATWRCTRPISLWSIWTNVSRIHRYYPFIRWNGGKTRLMLYRIKHDWYGMAEKILQDSDDAAEARRDLRESLLSIAPLFFQETAYFMSEEYSFT